jgi:Electron transfer flavoprotein, alpha subunit
MMKKALLFVEKNNVKDAWGLLEVLRQMYPAGDCKTYALFVNQSGVLGKGYVDYSIELEDSSLEEYDISKLSKHIKEIQEKEQFDCIIISATNIGRMLAPRLAMKLHTGLVADVTSIRVGAKKVEMVRPAFDGKILAGITNEKHPQMLSVRPGVFAYCEMADKDTHVSKYYPENLKAALPKTMVCLSQKKKEVSNDIRDSEVLISGGGGIKEHFAQMEPLAKELNGMISASRSIVDSGVATRDIQVGQSGKTVSPKLYIAIGIYGAIQHFEGLRDVECIISVNLDKQAPICSVSDIVVEGDAYEFVEKLLTRIKNKTKK